MSIEKKSWSTAHHNPNSNQSQSSETNSNQTTPDNNQDPVENNDGS